MHVNFLYYIWEFHMHQNTPNYNPKPHFGLLGLPGGASGGQKVIQLWNDFFLVESVWSFRQNILYLSQVSGLGGHGPWFSLSYFPLDYHPPPNVQVLYMYLSTYRQMTPMVCITQMLEAQIFIWNMMMIMMTSNDYDLIFFLSCNLRLVLLMFEFIHTW